jgi:hypothetical protein
MCSRSCRNCVDPDSPYADPNEFNSHSSTLLTHGAEPFLMNRQFCSYSRISQHFMEPEGALTCSQESSTGAYPESDHSNPYHPILSL